MNIFAGNPWFQGVQVGLNTHETTFFASSAVFVVFMVSIPLYMAWHAICTISTYNAYMYTV